MLSVKYVILFCDKSQNHDRIFLFIMKPADSQPQINLKEFRVQQGKTGPSSVLLNTFMNDLDNGWRGNL